MRSFLVDMTFFRTVRNHIILCILIEVWPEFFRMRPHGHAHPSLAELDPLLQAYLFMVHNSGPDTSKGDLKVKLTTRPQFISLQRCTVFSNT